MVVVLVVETTVVLGWEDALEDARQSAEDAAMDAKDKTESWSNWAYDKVSE